MGFLTSRKTQIGLKNQVVQEIRYKITVFNCGERKDLMVQVNETS